MTTVRLRDEIGSDPRSLRDVATALGCDSPVSIQDLVTRNALPIVFEEAFHTDDSIGANHRLELRRDGSYLYSGSVRATAFPSYDFNLVSALGFGIPLPGGDSSLQFALQKVGRVHGDNELGNETFNWDDSDNKPQIAQYWPAYRKATWQARFTYKENWLGAIGDIGSRIGAVVAMGVLFGPTGAAIALAGEGAELADHNELIIPGLVGVLMASGVAYLVTPGLLIPAFIAGAAVTPALIQQRSLHQFEINFAKRVFGDKVPYERIMLTNFLGLGLRGFTTPGPGTVIFVNVGKGFDNPSTWPWNGAGDQARAPGSLFIHELTHAWQIEHHSFTPFLYCEELEQLGVSIFDKPFVYRYGLAGRDWDYYLDEQQASIVADWFAGNLDMGGGFRPQQAFPPMCENDDPSKPTNPYFRYIRDNIRTGMT